MSPLSFLSSFLRGQGRIRAKLAHHKSPVFSNFLLLVPTLSLALCHPIPLVITSVTIPYIPWNALNPPHPSLRAWPPQPCFTY